MTKEEVEKTINQDRINIKAIEKGIIHGCMLYGKTSHDVMLRIPEEIEPYILHMLAEGFQKEIDELSSMEFKEEEHEHPGVISWDEAVKAYNKRKA